MSDRFRCGGVTVVPAEGRLIGSHGAVHVRPKSMEVLVVLAEHEGDVVAKRELLGQVWGEAIVSEAVLTNAISELRRALDGVPGGRRLIETVSRRGYRLTAPVEDRSPRVDVTRSLAVMPFEDLSPEQPSDTLLRALHDALVGELARFPSLRVLARQATERFGVDPRPLARLGRELHVQKLVTGSAVRHGSRLRLNAQLVDLASDGVIWSTSLVVALGDPIELQSSLAGTLARELARALDLPPAPPHRVAAPLDRHSSELFLRAQLRLRGSTLESLGLALADLDEVIRRTPDLAAAHASRARGLFLEASWRADPDATRLARAENSAARALSIEPDSIEGRIWWIMTRAFGGWRPADALWDLARIVSEHPHNPEARDALAHCLAALGRPSEAAAEVQRALADDPLSPSLRTALGFFHRASGSPAAAASVLAEALELHPDWTIARLELGRTLLAQGLPQQAAAEIARVEPDWGRFLEAIADGRRREVQNRLDEWRADPNVAPYWLAERCMWASEEDRAIGQLERAHAEHQLRVVYIGVDPVFDPLRSSARFQRLLAQAGVEPTAD